MKTPNKKPMEKNHAAPSLPRVRVRARIALFTLCALFSGASGARLCAYTYRASTAFPPAGFTESADARLSAAARWLEDEVSAVSMRPSETITDRFGVPFEFSRTLSPRRDSLIVSVKPAARGAQNAGKRATGAAVQSEWRLYRSLSTGVGEEIRIFPVADENVFVSLFPPDNAEKKSVMAVEVYGLQLCKNIPLGVPFEKLYTLPLETVFRMTETTAPWYVFSHDASLYSDIISAVNAIRTSLPKLFYTDDGAFDENGTPVHIEDLSPQTPREFRRDNDRDADGAEDAPDGGGVIGGVNCSGFVKWIADGIIRPAAGSGLYIEPLKTPTSNPASHFTEPYRERRDLFFGLDWCRNLAAAVVSLNAGKTVLPDESGTDVDLSVFAGGTGYHKDAGYEMKELLPLLYYLAVKEPGCFYLGALSRVRGDPPLRQYHHTAAFFPYFSPEGEFTVAVFESAAETPVSDFIRANGDAFIHLSRIRAPEAGRFILQNE